MIRTIALFAVGLAACKAEPQAQASQTAPAAPPGHYCNLGVFTPEELARHKSLVPKLAVATTERKELENGYEFKFSGQVKEAGELLDGTRRCCPTVEHELSFAPHAGPASLKITGGPGAKDFIREEFAAITPK